MRHGAILLSVLLSLSASPAMADPPNIENADHITGCLKTGRLLSFEISGWGAYRPCGQHGPDTEWITLQRANQNSRLFTVEAMMRAGPPGLHGPGIMNSSIMTPVMDVGAFRVYSAIEGCGIAVGPNTEDFIVYGGLTSKHIYSGYMVDLTLSGQVVLAGASRQGYPHEVFTTIWGDGVYAEQMLIVKAVTGWEGTNQRCRAAVTFEYLETPSAHTLYRHDPLNDEVHIEYRQED